MALNVNQATQQELEALPGVGPATAEKLAKARPIADVAQLEELIPPSAWLKIQDKGVAFAFGDEADRDPAKNDNRGAQPTGDVQRMPAPPQPVIKMYDGPEPMVLRRLVTHQDRPSEGLKPGTEYLCVWNMYFGPHGEAWRPEDAASQAATTDWFQKNSMDIKFAHWGPSVQIQGIPGLGLMSLTLFEIIREEEDEDGETV